MATIDRILVPTDYSDYSENACLFAEKLAKATQGVVDLLHVIPNSVLLDEKLRASSKSGQDLKDEIYPLIFSEAELKLNSLAKTHFQHKNRGDIYVKVDRSPAHLIANHAWCGNYSLVVMSTRGKDESGMFRGSTTEEVLRTSKVPVLSVAAHLSNLESGRIIVPVDGSYLSMAAIPAASLLASLFDASITFLYIDEKPGFFKEYGNHPPDDQTNRRLSDFLTVQFSEFIDDLKSDELQLTDPGPSGLRTIVYKNREITSSIEIVSGTSAHLEITAYANKYADMVVMTTHGRSGLAHIIMGSHAGKVALNTEKTVLTIRPDSKLFEKHNLQNPTA